MNTYININGEIENLSFKDIKKRTHKNISTDRMHYINKHEATYINKKYVDFLKKYNLGLTIFNFNNIVEWEHLLLYPHWVKIALKNGATDKRRLKND